MKELYIAPELELLCLAPAERIANNQEIDFAIPVLDVLNRGNPVLFGNAAGAQRQNERQSQQHAKQLLHSIFFLSFALLLLKAPSSEF